jgi:hypothetical protein
MLEVVLPPVALFPEIVQFVIDIVADCEKTNGSERLAIAPPLAAEFPEKVLFVIVIVTPAIWSPSLLIAPP